MDASFDPWLNEQEKFAQLKEKLAPRNKAAFLDHYKILLRSMMPGLSPERLSEIAEHAYDVRLLFGQRKAFKQRHRRQVELNIIMHRFSRDPLKYHIQTTDHGQVVRFWSTLNSLLLSATRYEMQSCFQPDL